MEHIRINTKEMLVEATPPSGAGLHHVPRSGGQNKTADEDKIIAEFI